MGTFLCPECGKNFSVDADLYLHQVRAHDTNSYTCENCGETVIGKKNLDNHMRKHNTAVMRLKSTHKCEECPYETKDKANLSKHTKRVHSEKPKKIKKSRECGECGKTFQHKGHFDTHVKSHNGRQSEPLKTCEYCDYKCCRNDDLEKHVKGWQQTPGLQALSEVKKWKCNRNTFVMNALKLLILKVTWKDTCWLAST